MYRDPDRQKIFTRRAVVLAGGQALLLGALAARLYHLQVLESDKYTTLAEENRISVKLLPPPRGTVVDRNGNLLALNKQNYRAVILRERSPDIETTVDRFAELVPLTEAERRRVMRDVRRYRAFVPVTIRENLTWDEVATLEVNSPDLPGVFIEMGQTRHYPAGEATAHLVGYVGAVAEADLTGDPLLELPGFQIGKDGVERVYDLALRGRAGRSHLEVNSVGRVIRELDRLEGRPGREVALTLDVDVQRLALERFGEESGAAVALDIHNGEVLVLASTPAFTPEAFARGIRASMWQELIRNPRAPLTNKAIAGQYAPGSTFKMMVALAALESGLATPETRVSCDGAMELGAAKFHCWKKGGHGALDMAQGLQHSCDVYFYEMARRVGIDRIAAMSKRFGLGGVTGIDLPGERPGLMPTRDWKKGVTGVAWQPGESLVAGIGQGFITATPLQLAVMTARIANGGKAVIPHVTRDTISGEDIRRRTAPIPAVMGVTPAMLNLVRTGMELVVNDPRGTAYGARIVDREMRMAGKTGTSQVRRISERERQTGVRRNEDKPWEERDHALFVGFAPVHEPRFACAVIVEHGGGGSKVAAPIVRDILRELQHKIPPRGIEVAQAAPARDDTR